MRDRLIACGLGVLALAVYACALEQSYAFWDTGELQIVASVLGIEHPPGSPAFVLLAYAFVHLLPLGEQAWRVNFFSALAVAVSVSVLYLTMRALRVPPVVGTLCALAFAFSKIALTYATRAEVHDLALCFSACALYAAVRYERTRRVRDAFFCALALGLFGATHGVAIFFAPAIALVFILCRFPRERAPAGVCALAGGLAIGLLPYAYIAPRAAWLFAHRADLTLSIGLPPGLPFWDYGDPETPARFWAFVTGAEFHVHSGFAGYLEPVRYLAYGGALVTRFGAAYGYVGTILATLGAVFLAVRRDVAPKAIVLAALLAVPYTESYVDLQDPDRYYLLALWCGAIAIAIAFERIADLLLRPRTQWGRAALAATLVCALAFAVPSRGNVFTQFSDRSAADYVAFVKSVTPNDAIVLAEWAYSSPIAYASYVEHDFGDRIPVASGPAQYESHFREWLARKRPLYVVSFSDDLTLPPYRVQRETTDQSYYVYKISAP